MGMLKTINNALGIRKYIFLSSAGGLLGSYKWGRYWLKSEGYMTLPDIPAWEIFIWITAILFAWWFLQHANKLEKHLMPRLTLEFDSIDKSISDTYVRPLQRPKQSMQGSYMSTGTKSFSANFQDLDRRQSKWVHIKASTTTKSPVHGCEIKLSSVDKWSDKEKCFQSTKYNIPQVISWSGVHDNGRHSPKIIKVDDPVLNGTKLSPSDTNAMR